MVFGHAAHWIESVLVLVPTVGFVLWLAYITVRDRMRSREWPGGE
jgi:cytochrome c oxidase assembly factor CtaG